MTTSKQKIGFLPLYLELYDKKLPNSKPIFMEFTETITSELSKRNLDVVTTSVCRVADEFADAIVLFEKEKVDAIVTLHLAYSPSMESAKVLAETNLPIIVLDTTPDYNFTPGDDSTMIFANHGIHGVMDMCNLLTRNGKAFQIEAGHWKHSDVLDRVVECVSAAKLASFMKNIRIGLIGNPFDGMGDFVVPYDKLKKSIGIDIIRATFAEVARFSSEISDKELEKEIALDKDVFSIESDIDDTLLKAVNRDGLTIRKWIKKENLSGFSVNFNEIKNDTGLTRVPFLEGSKTMMRGLGYAGEGDILTASLMATFASEYPETSFVEIFCPGWETDTLLLSHMGEMNLNLCAEKPELIKYDSDFVNQPTLKGVGCFKPGNAMLINLAPLSDETFRLIATEVDVLDITGKDNMRDSVRGWIKPQLPLQDFLPAFSKAAGTHHQILVYNADIKEIAKFAEIMQWDMVKI